jgi:hypothetical protein
MNRSCSAILRCDWLATKRASRTSAELPRDRSRMGTALARKRYLADNCCKSLWPAGCFMTDWESDPNCDHHVVQGDLHG